MKLQCIALQEQPCEIREILPAFSKGKKLHRDDVDTVVEVFTETPLPDRLFEVDVRRDNEAEAGLNRLAATDSFNLFCLNFP